MCAAIKDVVPIAKYSGRKKHPWITAEIVARSKKKNRAYRAARRNSNNPRLWANYKRLRNDVKFLTRQSYVHDLALNCSSNPERFWSFVGNQRRQSTITSFETEDGITDDPIRIAHNFNSFFQSNFTNNPDESGYISCDHEIDSNFRFNGFLD